MSDLLGYNNYSGASFDAIVMSTCQKNRDLEKKKGYLNGENKRTTIGAATSSTETPTLD